MDLGELHWMLGIEVKRDRPGRIDLLSQRAYIDAILRHYHLTNLKPLSTPMGYQVTRERRRMRDNARRPLPRGCRPPR
jgi:hypothetical protein